MEQNLVKLWDENKNHQLTSSEMLIYLFLTYQWKKNNHQKFTYSDYVMTKELKLSRQTIIKSKKKLRKVHLLEFSHCTGMPTVYSFPDFKEVKKVKKESELWTIVDYEIAKDTPTQEEFLKYAKSLRQYKDNYLPDILKEFEKLDREDWVTEKGKIKNWKAEANRILMNVLLSHFRKQH